MQKIKKVVIMISSDEAKLFTNGLAYSLLVGIAPLLIILVAFFGTYVVEVDQIIAYVSRFVPADLVMPFVNYIKNSNINNLGILISLLSASLWVGSKSVHSFMMLNRSYSEKKNLNSFLVRLLAVVYFVVIVLSLLALLVVALWVDIDTSFLIVPVAVMFLLIFYRITGSPKERFNAVLPGSIIAAILILLFGQLFFVYVNDFSSYSTIYGPLASIVVTFLSSWIVAWILFFGYAINYVYRKDIIHDENGGQNPEI